MNTFLTFLPLIIVTIVLGFGCLLVIDDARRHWQESDSPQQKTTPEVKG
jgi:hypothetical protein